MLLHHLGDRPGCNSEQITGSDPTAAVLVGELAASASKAFVDTSHPLASPVSFRCLLLRLRAVALRFGKCGGFGFSEEAGGGTRRASGPRGHGLQPHVNAYRVPRLREQRGLSALPSQRLLPLPLL